MRSIGESRALASELERESARAELDAAVSEDYRALWEERLAMVALNNTEYREASARASLKLAVLSGMRGSNILRHKTAVDEAKTETVRASNSLRMASEEASRSKLELSRARKELTRASEERNRTQLRVNRAQIPEYSCNEDDVDALARGVALCAREKAAAARKIVVQSRIRAEQECNEHVASPTSVNPRGRNSGKGDGILMVLPLKPTFLRLLRK